MIRARMSFSGAYGHPAITPEQAAERKLHADCKYDHNSPLVQIDLDEAIRRAEEARDTKKWIQLEARWNAVYTPNTTNPNAVWASATPSGEIKLSIQNPGAWHAIKQDVEWAELHGRKNVYSGDKEYPTKEFYVDIYPAPAEDLPI